MTSKETHDFNDTLVPDMRIFFIINSRIPRASITLRKLQSSFEFNAEFHLTKYAGHARQLALQATDHHSTHIVAVGGNGTINEVINGILESVSFKKHQPMFTFLPRGSGNDLARTLKCPADITSLKRRINHGTFLLADVGLAEFYNNKESSLKRYFLNVMDLGLGSAVAKQVEIYRKGKWSFLSYQRALLTVLPTHRSHLTQIKINGLKYSGKVLSIVLANGKWFGGGLGIAPDADLTSGKLQVVILGKVGVLEYLRYLPRILLGKKINHKEVHYLTSSKIKVEGECLTAELDGEVFGAAPVCISIQPGILKILV